MYVGMYEKLNWIIVFSNMRFVMFVTAVCVFFLAKQKNFWNQIKLHKKYTVVDMHIAVDYHDWTSVAQKQKSMPFCGGQP